MEHDPRQREFLKLALGAAGVATFGALFRPNAAEAAAVAQSAAINVKAAPYNAKGDGVTDDTAAIQAAINALAGQGGVVCFPRGVYRVSSLTWHPEVSLIGEGLRTSTLLSNASSQLLTVAASNVAIGNGSIQSLGLDGNGLGTVGLSVTNIARFFVDRVLVRNFTDTCIRLVGGLVIQISRSQILSAQIGIDGSASSGVEPNLVAIRDCVLESHTKHALRWSGGSLLIVDGCDIENSGTAGDDTTAAVYISGMCPHSEGVACVIDQCWLERNNGYSAVRVGPPVASTAVHVIQNTHILSGTRSYGVAIDDAGALRTSYRAVNVVAQNASVADFLDTVTAKGILIGCSAGRVQFGGVTTRWNEPAFPDIGQFTNDRIRFAFLGGTPPQPVIGMEMNYQGAAGETPVMLYDIAAGQLKRVSVGAPNSGGTGFRLLRVPN